MGPDRRARPIRHASTATHSAALVTVAGDTAHIAGEAPPPFARGRSPSGSTRTTSSRPRPSSAELCAQAGLALRSGFDGVMTSEHHGGFAGVHGAAPADGLLRAGGDTDGLGRRRAAPATRSDRLHSSPRRSHGCRPVIPGGSGSVWRQAPCRWISRWPTSDQADSVARSRPSSPARRHAPGRGAGRARRRPGAPACRQSVPSLCSAQPCRSPRPSAAAGVRRRHPLEGMSPPGATGRARPGRSGRPDGHGHQGPDPPGLAGHVRIRPVEASVPSTRATPPRDGVRRGSDHRHGRSGQWPSGWRPPWRRSGPTP